MFTCTKPNCHYMFDFDGSAGDALNGALSDGYFPMSGLIGRSNPNPNPNPNPTLTLTLTLSRTT